VDNFFQIDFVGALSWQAQLKGTKKWMLESPPECWGTCGVNALEIIVEPGDVGRWLFVKFETENTKIQFRASDAHHALLPSGATNFFLSFLHSCPGHKQVVPCH